MIPTLLFAFLTCSTAALGAAADDSIITKSALVTITYRRSVITNSGLTSCRVERSAILGTLAKGSAIAYTLIGNSTITGSILNATYSDHHLDRTSTAEVFRDSDRYYFNRIYDSKIVNAKIDASPNCLCSDPGYNNTVYMSYVLNSTVRHSKVMFSNLTDDSASCVSVIGISDLCRTSIRNSVIRKLKTNDCTLTNVVIENSLCQGSTVTDSKLEDSTVLMNSVITNSVISNQAKIVGSTITTSKVSNSKLTNCVITNSNVVGKEWDSVVMVNNIVQNSETDRKHRSWWH